MGCPCCDYSVCCCDKNGALLPGTPKSQCEQCSGTITCERRIIRTYSPNYPDNPPPCPEGYQADNQHCVKYETVASCEECQINASQIAAADSCYQTVSVSSPYSDRNRKIGSHTTAGCIDSRVGYCGIAVNSCDASAVPSYSASAAICGLSVTHTSSSTFPSQSSSVSKHWTCDGIENGYRLYVELESSIKRYCSWVRVTGVVGFEANADPNSGNKEVLPTKTGCRFYRSSLDASVSVFFTSFINGCLSGGPDGCAQRIPDITVNFAP